jgi:octaprenyl-diphosphate synthase
MSSLLADSNSVIHEQLAEDLAEVERRFAAELRSDLSCVNHLAEHVERFRGKMLRPTLVLLSSMAIEPDRRATRESHQVLATVVEMVHMATLVHDDILDEAELRRRGSTINQLRGNEAAVMLGDYLISHAYHLCSAIGEPRISQAIAEATNHVCEGELLQLHHREDWSLDESTYFEMIRRKTAGFCGRCCELSGRLAEADQPTRQALHTYGEKLGLAFQIVDDVLDLTGDSERVGKTLGRDLEKGKLTLPLIRYLDSLAPAQRQTMQKRLESAVASAHNGEPQEGEASAFGWLGEQLVASGAVDAAHACAGRLVEAAKASLRQQLPDSPAQRLLLSMADAVLERDY